MLPPHPSSDQKSVTASFSPSLSVYVFKTTDLDRSYEEAQRLSCEFFVNGTRAYTLFTYHND